MATSTALGRPATTSLHHVTIEIVALKFVPLVRESALLSRLIGQRRHPEGFPRFRRFRARISAEAPEGQEWRRRGLRFSMGRQFCGAPQAGGTVGVKVKVIQTTHENRGKKLTVSSK
jgi:hypothetical protein